MNWKKRGIKCNCFNCRWKLFLGSSFVCSSDSKFDSSDLGCGTVIELDGMYVERNCSDFIISFYVWSKNCKYPKFITHYEN